MDEIVKAALKKWPTVPHCYGWLALDARGDWYMRDDRIQHAGPFPQVKGSRIQHEKLLAFIERNYAADEHGAWFFQNGPQRVYVQLEAAPWIWRLQMLDGGIVVHTHTGLDALPQSAWLDDADRLFLSCDIGFGLVHTQDVGVAADAADGLGQADGAAWSPMRALSSLAFAGMPARFGYQLHPAPPHIV